MVERRGRESRDEAEEYINSVTRLSTDDAALLGELEDGLEIDENDLDTALQQQPDIFYQVSKHLALLISRRDAAKQYVQTVEARADAEIRQSLRDSEDKVTEKDVESRKRAHPDVVRCTSTLMRLQASVGQFAALKEAFEQRSYALNRLSDLSIANWRITSGTSRSAFDQREATAQRAREAMNRERRTRE